MSLQYRHDPASVGPSSSTISANRSVDQVEILCGASLGSGIEFLFAISWSHDQNGCHAHIW